MMKCMCMLVQIITILNWLLVGDIFFATVLFFLVIIDVEMIPEAHLLNKKYQGTLKEKEKFQFLFGWDLEIYLDFGSTETK